MALTARYLADTSAVARLRHDAVASRLRTLTEARELATCTMIDLEVLFTAQSRRDYRSMRRDRRGSPLVRIDQPVMDRALEVQAQLAETSRHRAAKIPDLIIAAAAELAGLAVLHYDRDFDTIASVTGQPVEWVTRRGSIP